MNLIEDLPGYRSYFKMKIKDIPVNLLLNLRNLLFIYQVHREFSNDKNYSVINLINAIQNIVKDEKVIKFEDEYVLTSFLPPIPGKAFMQLIKSTPGDNSRYYENVNGIRSAPNIMHIAVTNRCNYDCFYCSNINRDKKNELDTGELIRLMSDLQDMGVARIGLTGGEPLLRDDIVEIVSSIDKRSVSILHTTGFNLSLKKAKELKNAGLFAMGIGLDHYNENICDQKKGVGGAFKTSVKAIKNSKKAGIYTILQVAVTKEMILNNELMGMVDLARKLGVHEIRFLDLFPAGRLLNAGRLPDTGRLLNAERLPNAGRLPNGGYGGADLPDEKDIKKIVEIQKGINAIKGYPGVSSLAYAESEHKFGCGAGSYHSYIDACGNLYPCDFVPLSFGNIQDKPIKELWAKMHNLMGAPGRRCFLRENSERIMELGRGVYPLNRELSEEICRSHRSSELPDFYKILGGFKSTGNKI